MTGRSGSSARRGPHAEDTNSQAEEQPKPHAGTKLGRNYRLTIAQLQQQVHGMHAQCEQLQQCNKRLQERESVLAAMVVAVDSDYLHKVSIAALGMLGTQSAAAVSMAESLCNDLSVHSLLNSVGGLPASYDEPYTVQRMRVAMVPERLQAIQRASLGEVVAEMRRLTMRLFHLLHMSPAKACFMAESVDSVVDQYVELCMLLHAAADRLIPEVASLNMEDMQRMEPPEAYYDKVLMCLNLSPGQRQTLASGFELYLSKSQPLVGEWRNLVQQMQHVILGPQQQHQCCLPGSTSSSGSGTHLSPLSSGSPTTGSAGGGGDMAGGSCRACSSSGSGSHACGVPSKPWQQFGLPSGILTVETAEHLEQLTLQLFSLERKLKEVHRNFIFLWINTLDRMQFAVSLVESYPFFPRPLTICSSLVGDSANGKGRKQQ